MTSAELILFVPLMVCSMVLLYFAIRGIIAVIIGK